MTREEFKGKVNNLSCHLRYPILDDLHAIDDHDAEQRAEITRLRGALEVALTNLRAWNGEQTWELYRKSPEIQVIEQALNESGHERGS